MLLFIFAIACFSDPELEKEQKFEPRLTGIKCVVSGNSANKNYWCEFKKGKVFFDCNVSRRAFLSEKTSFIVKANHQLAVTGQYVQINCPIKDVPIDPENGNIKSIAGVPLKFCCGGCLTQLNQRASIHEQIRFVFDNKKFNAVFQPRNELAGKNTSVR